jgi:hypothetical protein
LDPKVMRSWTVSVEEGRNNIGTARRPFTPTSSMEPVNPAFSASSSGLIPSQI